MIEVQDSASPVIERASAPPSGSISGCDLAFRDYRLIPEERLLLREGKPVELGGRAFDLLFVLLRSRGSVVGKEEIFRHVWPSTLVDESNLRFQMACLRRALKHDREVIKTVKGRGYILTAECAPSPLAEMVQKRDLGSPGCELRTRGEARTEHAEAAPIIAIIDDDECTREALEGLLRANGFRFDGFCSVTEFMQSGRQESVHCLILDVWLPGKSGLDFQEELYRQNLHVPVIFISGHADIQMSVRAMKAGAVEFLTKPIRHQDLLEAIEQAVRTSGQLH